MKYAAGFARFWYDFIVGDSVLLAVGGVAALVLAYALAQAGLEVVAEIVLPLLVAITLVVSLPRIRG